MNTQTHKQKSFKSLVKNMEVLKQDEQGKLKGGFQAAVEKAAAIKPAALFNGGGCWCI